MSSREIRDLAPDMQAKYNRFHDRCRRDLNLLKHGIHVLLTCTWRSGAEMRKMEGLGWNVCGCQHSLMDKGLPCSKAFDVALLRYGKIVPCEGEFWDAVVAHAESVGLIKGCEGFHGD